MQYTPAKCSLISTELADRDHIKLIWEAGKQQIPKQSVELKTRKKEILLHPFYLCKKFDLPPAGISLYLFL